ncbi:MAG: AAA family ATPase [Clostridia bacterium]|nr:AAA family ATPase [Clostridia bacterium]
MDIKSAKQQIQNAIAAYLKKDELGNYRIPLEKQRPIFLLGAPGIGKTAIMEQIAQELGISLVSYSMTHHTRQSALGLPFILRKSFGGVDYDVSEYTMSEIIAAVYDTIEETGIAEGILFLDEVNCVSETLAPAMLQFLQFKIFGRHRLPRGWMVVTAGNPPEYNKSVREFDIVTMDRLKRIDVEPDYAVWKDYAWQYKVHGSILSYLDLRQQDFYSVESTLDGKSFVTARGWEDLSKMMVLSEELGLPVDYHLTGQYLQNPRIAREFALYYELYNTYKDQYRIESILSGQAGEEAVLKAQSAPFDERLSLLGLLLDAVGQSMQDCLVADALVEQRYQILKSIQSEIGQSTANAQAVLDHHIQLQKKALEIGQRSLTLTEERRHLIQLLIRSLENDQRDLILGGASAHTDPFGLLKATFDQEVTQLETDSTLVREQLHHVFEFVNATFGDGQERMTLMSGLTDHPDSARFISRFGCDDYFAHSADLKLFDRHQAILSAVASLQNEATADDTAKVPDPRELP